MGKSNNWKFFISFFLLLFSLWVIDLVVDITSRDEGYFYNPPKQESQPPKQQNRELKYPPEGGEEAPEPLRFA